MEVRSLEVTQLESEKPGLWIQAVWLQSPCLKLWALCALTQVLLTRPSGQARAAIPSFLFLAGIKEGTLGGRVIGLISVRRQPGSHRSQMWGSHKVSRISQRNWVRSISTRRHSKCKGPEVGTDSSSSHLLLGLLCWNVYLPSCSPPIHPLEHN